jgi:hypothetical protein
MIPLERLKLTVGSAAVTDDRLLAAVGEAAADAARAWCGRDFNLAEHDEVLDGCPGERLLLRHYPLRAVQDVRGDPVAVLEVTNTGSEVARVTATRAGLELFRVASGVSAAQAVTWAANVTLDAVADAVNLLSGWSARCAAEWEQHPSEDLAIGERGPGLNAAGVWAGLRLHTRVLSDYRWHASGWLEGPTEEAWLAGPGAWRVRYTAGYPAVPAAVVEAACLWAAELFHAAARDPGLASQSVVGSLSQTWRITDAGPPPRARALLEPFRRRAV